MEVGVQAQEKVVVMPPVRPELPGQWAAGEGRCRLPWIVIGLCVEVSGGVLVGGERWGRWRAPVGAGLQRRGGVRRIVGAV